MTEFDLEKEIGRNQTVIVDSAFNFVRIVGWTNAIGKVVAGEATILLARTDGTMIRSAYLTFPRPLVIALKQYVGSKASFRKFKPDDVVTRSMILLRDDWTCYICEGYGDTMEHLIPESRDGTFTWGNIAVACSRCNGLKKNMTPDEFGVPWPKIPSTLIPRRDEKIQQAIFKMLETAPAIPPALTAVS